MKVVILYVLLALQATAVAEAELGKELEGAYQQWRTSMVARDARMWQQVTAPHRQMEVRNRIVSQKQPFPAAVFDLPTAPPALKGLKLLSAKQNGATAKAAFFGKVDFGVEGEPTENLLVLAFVKGGQGWLYDRADFVNLTALPDVRKELAAGNVSYLKGVPEAQPSGVVPPVPISAAPAMTIAKVYVFCPGREVQVQVNKISRHRFANAKDADLVIGGALLGANEVQYSVKGLEGGTGKEAMTIRVYLLSEVPGMKPIKAFEYQVAENGAIKPFGTGSFALDGVTAKQLSGK